MRKINILSFSISLETSPTRGKFLQSCITCKYF